jgi:hypothetical protein
LRAGLPNAETQVNHQDDAKKEQLRYLFYEFWMLAETHKRLLAGIGDTVIQNALIEAFCTHARNLNEFFLEVGWDHALKASDFTAGDYKWPPNSEERKALIAKINKQISHLTDQRTLTAQEKIGERDRTALYELLVADFKNFTQYLRPELRPMREVF